MRIRFTTDAIQDLQRLREFVESKNPHAARRIAAELLDGIENLAIFPGMGLPVTRAPDARSIRDLFVGSYTVRYLKDEHTITILRIWHDKEAEKNS